MKAKTFYVDNVETNNIESYYTVPNNTRSKLIYLDSQHDTGTGSTDIDVYVHDGSTNHHIAKESLTVGQNATVPLSETSFIMLEAGHSIRAQASGSPPSGIQLVFTVEESQNLVVTQ